jgi:hypothetical protein
LSGGNAAKRGHWVILALSWQKFAVIATYVIDG